METRASYILVGSFVLMFLVAVVAAVVWLAGIEFDEETKLYDVFFEGSVSGLEPGNPVRYRGIPVGVVSDMQINPENVEQVQVTIEVPEKTPIKEDAEASLEFQGITGVAYIQISGGSNEAPPLDARPGETRPVIPSTPSQIQEVIERAPELLNRFTGLVDRANQILSAENRKNFDQTMANLATFTGALANSSDDIERTMGETADTLKQLRATAKEAETLIAGFSKRGDDIAGLLQETLAEANALTKETKALIEETRPVVADTGETVRSVGDIADAVKPHAGPVAAEAEATMKDVRVLTRDLRQASANIAKAADQAAKLMRETREPVKNFANSGLYEFTQLVTEMRVLVASLSRIATDIERDPARFFFGDSQEGFEAD